MRSLFLLLFLTVSHAWAAGDSWLRLTTPNFEMYTTAGEKRARETVLYFEQIRSFFVKAAANKSAPVDFPVRIIAFKSAKQYAPYAPNSAAAAFYVPGRSRDYIVMGDIEPEHLPSAIHEYTHLLVHHIGLKLPVWLNEGLADVYSTLKPKAGQALVGDLIPGRVVVLQQQKWLPFDVLTNVGHDSPIYNEKDRAGIFYAESWALVHMLYLSPDYRTHFSAFLSAIHKGGTTEEACQTAFGKSGAQVYKDLRGYLTRNQLYGELFDVKLSKSEENAEVAEPEEFETALVSADLMAVSGKRDRARTAYQSLAATYPNKAEVPHSLGYLEWQDGHVPEARTHFETAFDTGSTDPQMCYHLAMLELQSGGSRERVIPALLRALQYRADYTDARMELGFAEIAAHDYPAAVAAFTRVQNIDSERAARLFNGLAYANAEDGKLEAARRNAEEARKWGRSEQDKRQTEELLSYLDSREKPKQLPEIRPSAPHAESELSEAPPRLTHASVQAARNPFVKPGEKIERVEGTAKSLNCTDKGATLTITSQEKTLTFDMPRPDEIQLKHSGQTTFDFTCGPQKPFRVAVEYVPTAKGAATAGELKLLEF